MILQRYDGLKCKYVIKRLSNIIEMLYIRGMNIMKRVYIVKFITVISDIIVADNMVI